MGSLVHQGSVSDNTQLLSQPQFSLVPTSNVVGLMLLDILGFALILIGLALQYGSVTKLPGFLQFNYNGLALIAIGIIMTLPFFVLALKACHKAFRNISLS
ncbi:hypothetical protein [Paraglaciecola hydrolytica]|uniref:DUF1418 domain-containing protein n=1 Tax=Paraglaciecola hydrolytica TaxID=1799789 RepID=A0A136A2A7_9ALTE|nr:hypothetical protein [Paraglaciecola hydrolytica]KXI29379.1 hypothetical protein AX660_14690 [Paraglaciecola hydrolytica]